MTWSATTTSLSTSGRRVECRTRGPSLSLPTHSPTHRAPVSNTMTTTRVRRPAAALQWWWLALLLATTATAQVLTPPYFNLAENRRITASATCGEGVADPELYCKLVGANADGEATELIQGGQVSYLFYILLLRF